MDPITLAMLGAGGGPAAPTTFDALGIGGGGAGGGDIGGGGGAGEMSITTNITVPSGDLLVVPGAGGVGAYDDRGTSGLTTSIYDSTLSTPLATWLGGGAGGSNGTSTLSNGLSGACGGGASLRADVSLGSPGTGTVGFNGGNSTQRTTTNQFMSGGGGGMGSVGDDGTQNPYIAGDGGAGLALTFNGVVYEGAAGGGAGAIGSNTFDGVGGSVNGTKYGGDGGESNLDAVAGSGSGGGGFGGSFGYGGAGGSGKVVISYPASFTLPEVISGDVTITTTGGFHFIEITTISVIRFTDGTQLKHSVEDLFFHSSYTDTLTKDIGIWGEGLYWHKARGSTNSPRFGDTTTPPFTAYPSSTSANQPSQAATTNYLGEITLQSGGTSGADFFFLKKWPGVLDIVNYTGDGTSSQTIPHNLGRVPGMIIVKATSETGEWCTYHSSAGTGYGTIGGGFQAVLGSGTTVGWGQTTPTADNFYVGYSAGDAIETNTNKTGVEYRAYIFAEEGVDDYGNVIYKTGQESTSTTLGWTPDFLLYRNTSTSVTDSWRIAAETHGIDPDVGNGVQTRFDATAQAVTNERSARFFGDGFSYGGTTVADFYYLAFRKPHRVRDDITSGGAILSLSIRFGSSSTTDVVTTSKTDCVWIKPYRKQSTATGGLSDWWCANMQMYDQHAIRMNSDQQLNSQRDIRMYRSDWYGYQLTGGSSYVNKFGYYYLHFRWANVPGAVTTIKYDGSGNGNKTVPHNHGVAPEVIMIKCLDRASTPFQFVFNDAGTFKKGEITTDAAFTTTTAITSVSADDFVVNSTDDSFNRNASTRYSCQLFSSVSGVIDIGKFTGTGAAGNQIDCGFSNGSRFVLIKAMDSTSDWAVFTNSLGMNGDGNDDFVKLNSGALTQDDGLSEQVYPNGPAGMQNVTIIKTITSGFEMVADSDWNTSGTEYFYMAISV